MEDEGQASKTDNVYHPAEVDVTGQASSSEEVKKRVPGSV